MTCSYCTTANAVGESSSCNCERATSLLVPEMFQERYEMSGSRKPLVHDSVVGLQKLLTTGQMRADDAFHNASWYNRDGAKIGWGDLSQLDLSKIPGMLPEGELFVVCYESTSFWEFKRSNPNGDPMNPGRKWLITNAVWVATYHWGWFAYDSHVPDEEIVVGKPCYRRYDSKQVVASLQKRSHLADLFRQA